MEVILHNRKFTHTVIENKIDLFLCDLPYGKTSADWDTPLDLYEFWAWTSWVTHERTAFVHFAQTPFSYELYQSNEFQFRYSWIWEKNNSSGGLNANRRPMQIHEEIMVFYDKLPTYNPQKTLGKPNNATSAGQYAKSDIVASGGFIRAESDTSGMKFPTSVLRFDKVAPSKGVHPSQKPVELLCYLIETYTNPGDWVCDPTMGSGSTGVACIMTGRNFIGFEKKDKFFNISKSRINGGVQVRLI